MDRLKHALIIANHAHPYKQICLLRHLPGRHTMSHTDEIVCERLIRQTTGKTLFPPHSSNSPLKSFEHLMRPPRSGYSLRGYSISHPPAAVIWIAINMAQYSVNTFQHRTRFFPARLDTVRATHGGYSGY